MVTARTTYFNNEKLCILSRQWSYVFHMFLKHQFPEQYYPIHFHNENKVFSVEYKINLYVLFR
jgi:hypothetical protein